MKSIQSPHELKDVRFESVAFENGQVLPAATIRYEAWGRLNSAGDNAILIAHALTGTSHCTSNDDGGEPGWWESLIGPGKAVDTNQFYVICPNVLGGCSGSSGPSSIDETTGRPFGLTFPAVTIRDMVRAEKRLIDMLGVNKLLTIVGGSMGGMQALEWAAMFPDQVESIIPIASPGRAYPQSIAFRKAQRKAIMLDPDWRSGNYYGVSIPQRGLELARMIGHITYRSEREFAVRFGRSVCDEQFYDINGRFEVEDYLEHQGQKLARWFDANTYLYLSKAMDFHDLGFGFKSYEEGVRRIRSKLLIIGIDSDLLFPVHQQKEIVRILRYANPDIYYEEVESLYGHDAFLVEKEQVSTLVGEFLREVWSAKTPEKMDA
ncbi:MAG: homoserine O-acetyltransferase MetX [Candidatus Zhuqueibacterota bacterium]